MQERIKKGPHCFFLVVSNGVPFEDKPATLPRLWTQKEESVRGEKKEGEKLEEILTFLLPPCFVKNP